MENIYFIFGLQKGLVKELCSKGLLTEEQVNLAIKQLEQIHEKNIIEKEVGKK